MTYTRDQLIALAADRDPKKATAAALCALRHGIDLPNDLPGVINRDVNLVRQHGLYAFIRLAWPLVEPGTPFVPNWHLRLMCRELEDVTAGKTRKLIINIPPGCMKSRAFSTFWPAWEWTFAPHIGWLYGAATQELANKNAKEHRDLVLSDWYKARWTRARLDKDSSKSIKVFENTEKGIRYSLGVNSGTTGRHVHRINYDDLVDAKEARGKAALDMRAIKKANEWWDVSAKTRQKTPKETTYVGIQQRLHFHDTAAMCLEQGYRLFGLQMEYDPEWPHNHPDDPRTERGELLWADRYGPEEITELKRMPARQYEAQYQQNPAPAEGALFKDAWFQNHWDPETLDYSHVILTVDCTFKDLESSDWVVVQAWARAGKKLALLDQWRGQWDIFATVAAVKRARMHYPAATIHVEDKANGPAVVKILKRDVGMVKEWSPGRTSKGERASAAAFVMECGDVLFPPPELAPWFPRYTQEHIRFPVGLNDDQVDGTSMAIIILTEKGLSVLDAFD